MRRIAVTVNGSRHEAEVEPRQLLVYFLRDQLGLTGTNVALHVLPGLTHAEELTRIDDVLPPLLTFTSRS